MVEIIKNLDLTENECLAVLSCRIGTIKMKRVSTTQDLVAKNMAICTNVDCDNDSFQIEYASEPKLAIAAAFLMFEFGIKKLLD